MERLRIDGEVTLTGYSVMGMGSPWLVRAEDPRGLKKMNGEKDLGPDDVLIE
jgi:hypothetical protein